MQEISGLAAKGVWSEIMNGQGGVAVSDDRKPLGFYEEGKGKEIVDRTELPRSHSDHLSPEQAAKMLGVSPGAIYKARMRRRKKDGPGAGRREAQKMTEVVNEIVEGFDQVSKERDEYRRKYVESERARKVAEEQLNAIRIKIAGVQHSRSRE